MGTHPINLAIRFILELCALASVGVWGWRQSDGWLKVLLVVGLPIILAAVWGIFAVPNDPSRSGKAPIAIPGILRLTIELGFFTIASLSLYDAGITELSQVFAALVILHYLASYDRIQWLIRQ